ncbi:hypothetical protein FOH24_07700 [Acetobacter tropicalis]|uniref:hypothetical protein n=1 Tax=Acetobacter tropicalis TaxID=104102 RepID=UPI00123A046F|nr:hypothetical protein [Acetobacter tropicalis]KAA8384040.1 hypothetical protein FOH22_15355 [Acetobacter tropicalis]KAA8391255.1 hypothetical protein FOH24_07700 [Acetobacter tropicalis]MDO8173235.1 hypothetical protein [Acetobacter tropicalis]
MTWQIKSTNLPYLNDIFITEIDAKYFHSLLPYAPLFSFLAACVTLASTWILTHKTHKIAKEKLDLDLFIKRFSIYESFVSSIEAMLSRKNNKDIDISKYWLSSREAMHKSILLLSKNSYLDLHHIQNNITNLYNKKYKRGTGGKRTEDTEYEKLRNIVLADRKILNKIFKQYTIEMSFEKDQRFFNSSKTTITSPASDPEPQPTGPKAILMRLKRAVCEWSRPLQ